MVVALVIPTSPPTSTRLSPPRHVSKWAQTRGRILRTVRCTANVKTYDHQTVVTRRSANYQPPIWSNDYVQSLNSNYEVDIYVKRAEKLKADVKTMLEKVEDPLNALEMVDDLQRLGVFYHFKDEIKRVLDDTYGHGNDTWNQEDLYPTALKFRLMRQHGYNVNQEVFNNFKDETGNFRTCLCEDTKGLLYLYEASYTSVEGENIMDEARNFSIKNLKENLKKTIDPYLGTMVTHALDLPLHWRMLRLEARWFIDVYERRPNVNSVLLEFAKLDFNMVQATYQEDIKHVFNWWTDACLGENLDFARDSMMEHFLWTVGAIFEPKFGDCRRMLAKVNALISIIDDMYDVYGTLEELELFTNAIERWDIASMEQLPGYMKICFLALFNSVNEMAYDTLKSEGLHIISYLKKGWSDICKSYLVEAKWYHSGHKPTLEEYLENAWISVSAPVQLVHAYFFVSKPITEEALQSLENYSNLIRWSSVIFRLANDLGTSPDELQRGDVPKSIQCYMHETGASEEDACKYIKYLIGETWKKVNEDRVIDSPFSETFIEIAINYAGMAQHMYQHGVGHASQDRATIDCISSLLINPLPLI